MQKKLYAGRPCVRLDDGKVAKQNKGTFIWAALLHLGMNMWHDRMAPLKPVRDHLWFDENVWRDVTQAMHDVGMNMVVIDLGEGMAFKKHPELAVKGTWSQDKMRRELDRLRGLGLEPIPKLNFSSLHDAWLGEYQWMLSTPEYYQVVEDTIGEAIEVFGKPRFMHLGWDEEENGGLQQQYALRLERHGDLWWHDFLFTLKEVEKWGVRPWAWHAREFDEWTARCPKSVLTSHAYYGRTFDVNKVDCGRFISAEYLGPAIRRYQGLDKAGYDQIPCATTWVPTYYKEFNLRGNDVNFPLTVAHCRNVLSSERLKGFLMAPWVPTDAKNRNILLHSIDLVGQSMKI